MNLFSNFFFSALFYHLLFCSNVICRISDKRKCANADCSEPISLAKTLIRYNADDDRLLSFPRNIKVKVYSKEAGDTPNFWEVEEEGSNKCRNYQGSRYHFLGLCKEVIFGKRGYVPKGLLREEKVIVPGSKLTHIVPTGRTDTPLQNSTKESLEQESISEKQLSATPELPVANSKGLFSTIGGVSADSVPMNSPDIKPQSTRKFQVFEGTTLYEDVVSEKPESPPTIIEETVNENNEIDKKLPSKPEQISNVPSPDIKPVNEVINENIQVIVSEQKNEEKGYKLMKEEGNPREERSEDKGNEAEESISESPSQTNFLGEFVNTVSNIWSSGGGDHLTEEELEEEEDEYEEGSAEEGHEENEEENNVTGNASERTTEKQSNEEVQPKVKHLETSYINTSEAPNLVSIVDEHSSDLKPNEELSSEQLNVSVQETGQREMLSENTIVGSDNGKAAEETKESLSEIKEEIEIDKHVSLKNLSEGKEEFVTNPIEVDNLQSNSTKFVQGGEKVKLPEAEVSTSNIDNVFKQTSHQSEVQNPEKIFGEVKSEHNRSVEKETPSKRMEDKDHIAPEHLGKSDANDQKVPDQPKPQEPQEKTDKLLVIEELPVQVQKNSGDLNVREQQKSEELNIQEQQEHEELHFQEQQKSIKSQVETNLEIDESQAQELPKTSEPLVQRKSESTTDSPPEEPTTRQFLYGTRQINYEGAENIIHQTVQTPSPPELHDTTKQKIETNNETSQDETLSTPDATSSSPLPTLDSVGSPKYSAVISRRIQSPELSDNESPADPKDEEESQPDHTNETADSTPIPEEALSSRLLPQSQSPKYSSVVSQRIGSFAAINEGKTDTLSEEGPITEAKYSESADVGSNSEEESVDMSSDVSQAEVKLIEEVEFTEEVVTEESNDDLLQDSQPHSDSIYPADLVPETLSETTEEGMSSWVSSFFDVFGGKHSGSTEESQESSESLVSSQTTQFVEETCFADGIEGSCPTLRDTMQKEVTWQESSYTSDMWEMMDKVPLEATIWLVITAVVVLIFSLGHYYIEAHRRDGPLVAIINKLEREVLILKKESCIMEDRLQIAQQQLEAWNTSSSENDALLVELKQELEETKAAKAELDEQAAQLKEELETVTESGLEMHRLLEESLSSQDGSQVLLSTVETLREKLQRQEEEISGLSDTLLSKNAEVEELQSKLIQSAGVARSLEDKVISVTMEKEEELLQLRDKHRELISQLEEVMETKALEETRLSTEMSKIRLTIEELQKTLAEKDSELDTLKEVVKQLRSKDSNEKIEALFDVVAVRAKLKTAVAERDDFREKFLEEEGARKLLEGHMKKITQEVADLKDSFETAEKEKIEALTKLQVLSNYFKEKESQLQKELGLQESMWLQKQSDDHTIYEQMRSLREENEKYKLQNESLKKEIVDQEASFKIQLANTEQKAHENWVASRQAERKVKEVQQEAAQLRNRLTTVEKNSASYSLDEKPNISESNGDPSSPPPSLMFPPTTSPPFMMYGPPPGDFVPPPPFMGSPYPSDSRPPPLGRISSPPLDHRFSPPPPLPYPPYDYPSFGHRSPSPPPHLTPHHRNVHKPQPREMSREQKDNVPNYSPDAEKTSRRNKR